MYISVQQIMVQMSVDVVEYSADREKTSLTMLIEPIMAASGFNIQSNMFGFMAPTYNNLETLSVAFINSHI